MYETDLLVAATALAAVFIGAFLALLFVCRRQHERRKYWRRLDKKGQRQRRNQIEPDLALALSDLDWNTALEHIIQNNEKWVDDASGLVPHCLAILRMCHRLTERLSTVVASLRHNFDAERFIELIRRIPTRVDDLVRSMYPPLDVRLLEARSATLVLAVGQLALLTRQKQNCSATETQWIDDLLSQMDIHLVVLRKAAIDFEGEHTTHLPHNQV